MAFLLFQIVLLCLVPVSVDDDLPPGKVAVGDQVEITESAFYEFIVSEYAGQELGRSLLDQVIQESLIEQAAEKRNLEVSDKQFDARIKELDLQFRVQSGGQSGLNEYMKEENLDEAEFFRVLKLSILQEMMACEDFDTDCNDGITVEKLNIWLLEQRSKADVKTERLGTRVMASVNGREITRLEFGKKLCQTIGESKVSKMLTEMIGIQLITARAREMGIEITEDDIRGELMERDARLKSEPGFETITYESYLQAAHGQSVDDVVNSDKFRGELLLKKICMALHHEAYLQDFFDENLDYFNKQYGEAARLSTIFFNAVKFPNQFVSRKFDEAMEELSAIKDRLERGEVSFKNMARIYSEHDSKKSGGDIGFVAAGTRGWEEVVKAALLADVGTLLGPFKTESGCHLVKVCGKRDNPIYEKIRGKVVREARQRYYQSLQKEAKIRRKY